MRTYDKSNAVYLAMPEPPGNVQNHPNVRANGLGELGIDMCSKCETTLSVCRCSEPAKKSMLIFDPLRGLNQTLLDTLIENAAEPTGPIAPTQPSVEPNSAPGYVVQDAEPEDAGLSDEDIQQTAIDYLEQNPLSSKEDIQDYLTGEIELTDEEASGFADRAIQQRCRQAVIAPAVEHHEVVRRLLNRRYQPGQIIELRVPGVTQGELGKVTYSGLYNDQERLIEDIAFLIKKTDAPAIYTGLQEIKSSDAYQKAVNNNMQWGRDGVSAENIQRYRWLLIDVDTIRAKEFIKCSSTDQEKAKAWIVVQHCLEYLNSLSIQPDLIDSGNSYHIVFAVDLEATAQNELLVKSVLEGLSGRFDSADAKIDCSVYDRPRICKLPGTICRKGADTPERPHRWSAVLSEGDQKIIPVETLLAIANLQEVPAEPQRVVATLSAVRKSADQVRNFLDWAGIRYAQEKPGFGDGGVLFPIISDCPFEHSSGHHENECCAGVGADGKFCFKCQHDSCKKIGWTQFRQKIQQEKGTTYRFDQPETPVEEIVIPKIEVVPYPVFPSWVMQGCSIYTGLVKPFCDVNSRYPEYMFMPGMVGLLNYLGGKVRIKMSADIPNIFLIAIGRRGEVIKSSSAQDALDYLSKCDILDHCGADTQTAAGKTLVWTVGSPEGLGIDMQRTNCKNALLFYDELQKLVNKAGIESSGLATDLLTLYESGKFQNKITGARSNYSFAPGSYAFSLIACTTDKRFRFQWGKFANGSEGLDDRFFFLYQPEVLMPITPRITVDTHEGVLVTKRLIEKAVIQAVYSIPDRSLTGSEAIKRLGNRTIIRAERFALGFAVDLGRDCVDEDCLRRGVALAEYETAVKKYLGTGDTETKLAGWQNEVRHILERQPGGRMQKFGKKGLLAAMDYTRFDTETWSRIYDGLIDAKMIVEIVDSSHGGKREYVQLLITLRDADEEDECAS